MNVMRLRWRPDPDAPPPSGVVGVGAVARALRAKLSACVGNAADRGDAPSPLMVAAHGDMLILTGASDALPWVDGARYIAPRSDAPTLWLPTHARPDVPLDLLADALARKLPPAQAQSSMLLWPDPAQLVPLHR
ncbi:MAG: hypothetical protein IT473_13680, partial [Lysobacter sp.]|nr:hypothetical protein [Lysobacter sp.]